jgi:signal transduction histidine kinase
MLLHVGVAGGINIMQTHLMPLFLVMGWIITRRFAQSLTDAERLKAELEQRVEAKRADIASHAEQVRQLTRQQALADERQRIMSDMHDGIGAQLISTLSFVERADATPREIAGALRECIDDLRLAIDSMEASDHDLLPALGNLRYRLDARLKAIGVTLDWHAEDLPRLARLTPQHVLHVLRILQEAFTNIIKHAQADTVRLDAGVDPSGEHVLIRVRDNGHGFDSPRAGGRGLANMRQRARTIGGELQVTPSAAGTTLSLLLPIG